MIWALGLFFKGFIFLSPLAHGEVRQCETTWLCPWNGCMKNTYKYDKIVCCCDEDFCNSATNGMNLFSLLL